MTKSIYDVYEVDTKLENEGVWVIIAPKMEVKVKVFGNEEHQKLLEKLKRPYRAQYRKGNIDPKIDEDIAVQAMAREVLVDWRGSGFADRDGKPLPYSAENAYTLLSEPSMRRFKGDIIFASTDRETFAPVELEDSIKNSQKSSNGTTNTGTKSTKSEKE